MPYSAKINRANPSCFLFVIDESGSMDESMESGRSKAQFVADVLNKTLAELIPQCTKADGVRAYFDVGVITYSGFGVGSGFGGNLSGGILHPISVINKNPLRVEEHNRMENSRPRAFSWARGVVLTHQLGDRPAQDLILAIAAMKAKPTLLTARRRVEKEPAA